jgi:protein-S-isoprenylcysteine O-methyltransferase Ste14
MKPPGLILNVMDTPRLRAAIGSLLFLFIAPGTLAGLVPWWLTGWVLHDWPQPYATPLRLAGAVLIVLGVPALLHAFARFVLEGIGTPAPVAPPEHLVVGGLYRYVRNPMYIALIATIVGQALVLAQPGLLLYAVVVAVAMVAFVYGYEEPTLGEKFGAEYDAYRQAVPAWRPRLQPWQPPNEPSD